MSHGWYTCGCGRHYHESEHSSGNCPTCSVSKGTVVNLFDEKSKRQSLFSITQAEADVQKYKDVVMKSVRDFHTFSVQEKVELYSSLAAFNVEILCQLLEYKKGEVV